ncbi:MAG TPA: hypothetical protein VEI01_07075 [Terriglobales bacterium]|nr:hypothetical protein [Terriglobales bacterium]
MKDGSSFLMTSLLDVPLDVFVFSLVGLLLSAVMGVFVRSRVVPLKQEEWEDFSIVIPATLTLLGLVIGFSFSMAAGRYDQRKNYEEAEANAIGTEYVRADLLSASDAAKVRELLKDYLDQRILFYETRDEQRLGRINAQTAQLQSELWSVVQAAAAKQPTYPVGLAVSGMNDVLNSQGYTQAAWWYRLPTAAWGFMAAIAIFSSALIGYSSHRRGITVFLVLPLAVSLAFFLIADIDSPRHGLIRVVPQNLISLSQSLPAE